MRIAVVGGGPAGLCSALVLSRAGHEVTLFERDPLTDGTPEEAFSWERNGIPHYGSPHAFIPRGRSEMRSALPDIYGELLREGALEIRFGDHLPHPCHPQPDDEELTYLAVRRQYIEWALRRALFRDGSTRIVSGERTTGLLLDAGDVPRARGIITTGGACSADLVVDAGGRRSPLSGWLRQSGAALPVESNEVGLIYYSRYYRVLPGCELPPLGATLGPGGDLGYCTFRCFPGDNGTFAFALNVPTQDREMRILRDARAFQAFCVEMPQLRDWVDPEFARPLTDVMPMGSLQNTLVRWNAGARPPAVGVIPVSDSWIHTDPMLALGLSNSVIHARAIASALAEQPHDPADAAAHYFGLVTPEAAERFQLATDIAAGRQRRLAGDEAVGRRDNLSYFLFVAGGVASRHDAEIMRLVVRRNGFLDSTAVLERSGAVLDRIERIYTENPPPRMTLPDRETLLARLREAVGDALPEPAGA